jgi:hypothetical protein
MRFGPGVISNMDRTSLLDLPVLPIDRDDACGTSRIIRTYVHERKLLTKSDQLDGFINRWKSVWLLSAGTYPERIPVKHIINSCREPIDSEVYNLFDGNYDLDKVFDYVKNSTCPDNDNIDDINFLVSCQISIPWPFLKVSFLCRYFIVCTDIGFVRLFLDTYPEYINEGRPFRTTDAVLGDE